MAHLQHLQRQERRPTVNRIKRSLKTAAATVAAAILLLTAACERRPLEVILDMLVKVTIIVKWTVEFCTYYEMEPPSGMTLMLWGEHDSIPSIHVTNNVSSVRLQLKPDRYKLIIFNQSFDEFGTFHFEDINSYDRIAARANIMQTRQNQEWDMGVRYICDPEPFAVALDSFEVTEDMIASDSTYFIWYNDFKRDPQQALHTEREYVMELPETPYPMTTVLHCIIRVKGIENMHAVEGSISGMADGFYLSRVDRTVETGNMFLPTWKATRTRADDGEEFDIIQTDMRVWGLPNGKEDVANRDSTDNVLKLCFTLVDGSKKTFTFNVGKTLRYLVPTHEFQERWRQLQHIQVEIVITDPFICPDLPDVKPDGEHSGFDAWVDPWEDGGLIDIGGL